MDLSCSLLLIVLPKVTAQIVLNSQNKVLMTRVFSGNH